MVESVGEGVRGGDGGGRCCKGHLVGGWRATHANLYVTALGKRYSNDNMALKAIAESMWHFASGGMNGFYISLLLILLIFA